MPAKADTSIIRVDLGRWKLVTSASTTWKRKPAEDLIAGAGFGARPPAPRPDARMLVVPIAITAPPAARAWRRSASTVLRDHVALAVHAVLLPRSSTRTGWKVPGAHVQGEPGAWRRARRCARAARVVEVLASGGRGDRAGRACITVW